MFHSGYSHKPPKLSRYVLVILCNTILQTSKKMNNHLSADIMEISLMKREHGTRLALNAVFTIIFTD